MLNDEARAILEFERGWWLEPGPKDQAIEFVLGLTAEVYYQRLLELVASTECARFDPLTVARVKAIIEPEPAQEVAS